MLEQIILIIHVVVCAGLIGLILLQKGKGAAMGAAFGSGASQTVFGSRGSMGFLMKLTLFLVALFFITTVSLTYLASSAVNQTQNTGILVNTEQLAKQAQQYKQQQAAGAHKGVPAGQPKHR